MAEPKYLFEGTHKPILDNEDRFVTAIEGQEAANYTTKEELFEQIDQEIIRLANGVSNEVQFRNTVTGALDSDSTFKYDKATGVLIAGKSFRDIPALSSVYSGFQAGIVSSGANNVFFGYQSGLKNTTGFQNLFIGYTAGASNTTGIRNTVIGALAGNGNTTGNRNTYIGEEAGYQNNGDDNVNLGRGAGLAETNVSNKLIIEANEAKNIAKDYLIHGDFQSRWLRINAAQLIRSFEITSIAPVVTGTVTSGTANTLTDSTKTYVLNQYANFVVEKTTVGGEKEQRVILSNTVAGQLTVRDNWTVAPVAGDTFKIITATIITADNLGSIYRFNLSSGYDHALILPAVNDTFNRAFCEFYIEGHANGAVLHKFPATGQLIQGQPKTEMVANREMVRLISHAQSTYHWDVESTVGLEAYVSATAAAQSVVAPNLTFTPITTAVTVLRSKRFQTVNVGGQIWMKYASSLGRSMQVGVGAAVINQSTPATVITVGVRIYKAATATTTDYTLVGSQEQLATTGQLRNFILADIFELESGDRLQVIHKASNNNNYDITASLQIR